MLFENIKSKNATWIKDKIGALLYHMIVYPKELIQITEINKMDRVVLASNWLKTSIEGDCYREGRVWNVIDEFYNGSADEFVTNLAIYIDKRLAQAYIKAKEHLDVSPSQVVIILDDDGKLPYGLEYQYTENYTSQLPMFVAPATEKQIEYLEALAIKNGYYFNDNGLTKELASSYINFLKNMDYETQPDNFDEHFIKAI